MNYKSTYVPHLMEPLKMLSPDDDITTVNIMKHSAVGATECILEESRVRLYDYFKDENTEKLNKYMEDLKHKSHLTGGKE